jgi:hypothetical protein
MLNQKFLEFVSLEFSAQLQYEAILLLPPLIPIVDAFEDALHHVNLRPLSQWLDVFAKVEGTTELIQNGCQVLAWGL